MKDFVKGFENMKGFKYVMLGLEALIENYVETGKPSKVDIGPINTIISTNYIDGLRTRLSAQTTANLNPHWFLKGYVARGWKSHRRITIVVNSPIRSIPRTIHRENFPSAPLRSRQRMM